MASYNEITILGNLTRAPEIRAIGEGRNVCKIGLATNRKYRQNDQLKEETMFIDASAFGKAADNIHKYTKKGDLIFIKGRLVLDQWEQDGQKRQKHGIVIDTFQFLPQGEKKSGNGTKKPDGTPPPRPEDTLDEDVPF